MMRLYLCLVDDDNDDDECFLVWPNLNRSSFLGRSFPSN